MNWNKDKNMEDKLNNLVLEIFGKKFLEKVGKYDDGKYYYIQDYNSTFRNSYIIYPIKFLLPYSLKNIDSIEHELRVRIKAIKTICKNNYELD